MKIILKEYHSYFDVSNHIAQAGAAPWLFFFGELIKSPLANYIISWRGASAIHTYLASVSRLPLCKEVNSLDADQKGARGRTSTSETDRLLFLDPSKYTFWKWWSERRHFFNSHHICQSDVLLSQQCPAGAQRIPGAFQPNGFSLLSGLSVPNG